MDPTGPVVSSGEHKTIPQRIKIYQVCIPGLHVPASRGWRGDSCLHNRLWLLNDGRDREQSVPVQSQNSPLPSSC